MFRLVGWQKAKLSANPLERNISKQIDHKECENAPFIITLELHSH